MANIRQIKRRIKSAQNTSKITKAMEMVAASKMRRAQLKALEARPYAKAIQDSLRKVAELTDSSTHPLLSQPSEGRDALVIISTNKGLCGSLNTNLMKATLAWADSHDMPTIIAVGKKAVNFVRLLGLDIYAQFTDVPESFGIDQVLPVTTLIMEQFLEQEFRSVDILFTDFVNTLSQQVAINSLLPVKPRTSLLDPTETIAPKIASEYTFEPNVNDLLNTLLPFYVENTMYQAMLEASASEHSARMVAMKNASENAKELMGELQLLYNKSRQASITSELLDITTAMLSLT